MGKVETTWETMKLTKLNPAEYNPREITDEALIGLENSLEEFGLVQNLVWNRRTGNLVGGHQRMKVMVGKGLTEGMVCVVDMSLKREKALNVALNNPHISGTFSSGLQELLEEIRDDDMHLFRDVHLDKLLAEEGGGTPDEDEIPDVPEVAISKLGDVWLLGDHRLMCGSSTEHGDVMKLVGDRHAVCMWTDPPYGVDYGNRPNASKTRTSHIANDKESDLPALLKGAFELACEYVIAPGSPVYVAHPAGRNAEIFYSSLEKAGFQFRQALIWVKDKFSFGRSDYHYRHEPIWYGFKKGDERFGRLNDGIGWHGDHSQTTVFDMPRPKVSVEHPTMKPVALVVKMVANSSRPLDWVYEPFCGSGTTLIACEQLGRRCMGMELDPLYCDVIVKRWEEQTGKTAVLEGSQPVDGDDPEPIQDQSANERKKSKEKVVN